MRTTNNLLTASNFEYFLSVKLVFLLLDFKKVTELFHTQTNSLILSEAHKLTLTLSLFLSQTHIIYISYPLSHIGTFTLYYLLSLSLSLSTSCTLAQALSLSLSLFYAIYVFCKNAGAQICHGHPERYRRTHGQTFSIRILKKANSKWTIILLKY